MADNKEKKSTVTIEAAGDEVVKEKYILLHLIPVKLAFFFNYGTLGSSMPFFNVFLTSVGLSANQAGLITGLRTIASFICGPLWGMLADHTGRRKLVYTLLWFGFVFLIFPFPWIAQSAKNEPVTNQTIISNVTNFNLTNPLNVSSTETTTSNVTFVSTTLSPLVEQSAPGSQRRLFIIMSIVLFLSAMFDQPLLGYYDSIVLNIIQHRKSNVSFGYLRMFGSIGFGVFNLIAGVAADHYEHRTLSSYTAVFFVFLCTGSLILPLGLMCIQQGDWSKIKTNAKENDINLVKTVINTFKNVPVIVFFVTVLIAGVGNAINWGFTFLLMEENMAASKSMMGATVFVSGFAEILTFPFATKIITFLGGTIPSIAISIFAYFVRFLMLSYVTNPWLVLPIQVFNCLCFGLLWAAAIEHTRLLSPPQISATMFSILNVIHFALGTLVGNMLGGYLYDKYGGQMFFRCSAILFLIWSVLLLIWVLYDRKYNRKQEETISVFILENLKHATEPHYAQL